MDQISDPWRLFNALLALIAFSAIAYSMITRWRWRKPRMRLMSLALLAFLLLTVEGNVEQIVQHAPTGPRTLLTTMACFWVIYAVISTPHDYSEIGQNEPRHVDDADR